MPLTTPPRPAVHRAPTGRRAAPPSSRSGRTLLGVWAHPDDEAFLSAGLMLEHLARGDRVVVVTATLGEHGTDDPGTWPPRRLAARRARELRRSLATLGVSEHRVLGFEDGDCVNRDGTDAIAALLTEIRPDRIVTFGPDGMTGHPDHRAVSCWTTVARQRALPHAELWYAAATADFHARWGHVNEAVGFWSYRAAPPTAPEHAVCHAITLTGGARLAKLAALRAHRSQIDALEQRIGTTVLRDWWATESFRAATAPVRAAPGAPVPGPTRRRPLQVAAA
jgi:LmbE family N-acetylglucosaminyl deacetylase